MHGSVLKVVRGTKSDDAVADRQNRTAAGMREWPSTQAPSKVRESTGHGQTHLGWRGRWQHARRNRLWWTNTAGPVRRHAEGHSFFWI